MTAIGGKGAELAGAIFFFLEQLSELFRGSGGREGGREGGGGGGYALFGFSNYQLNVASSGH